MGLFDDVVGAFLKGDAGKYQAILSWVEEQVMRRAINALYLVR